MKNLEQNRRDFAKNLTIGTLLSCFPSIYCKSQKSYKKPNILLIVADDMGYSDLGCYGGEIVTPYIDSLAENGIRFTNFTNMAKCGPTRASLLTGLYPHNAGLACWTFDQGFDGYRGTISNQTVTIAELLKMVGYRTYHVGKWHAGKPMEHWPLKRGFDRAYATIEGGGSYFSPSGPGKSYQVVLDDKVVGTKGTKRTPFYLTTNFTDYALEFLNESKSYAQPFFMYLAHFAPHLPLHALPGDIERYRGKYMDGWNVIRYRRFKRQKDLGVIHKDWQLSPPYYEPGKWESLSDKQKRKEDEKMAIYAAQIYRMDQGIGKILKKLKNSGRLDDTLIIFLSDNGATQNQLTRAWSNVSNTPFRGVKAELLQGGIATPFIVQWPRVIKDGGKIHRAFGNVIDLLPTFIDITGVSYPEQFSRVGTDYPIKSQDGISLMPAITDNDLGKRSICWEFQGQKAVRQDNWKLVTTRENPDTWKLYNMKIDGTETENLANIEDYRERLNKMSAIWERWANKVGVVPWTKVKAISEKRLDQMRR